MATVSLKSVDSSGSPLMGEKVAEFRDEQGGRSLPCVGC
ncbi:hypothetical protein NY08_3312 [Rhodococcus sp. B7740]|nr:hypothetical protein NY08_3312 [Rhodococcus sp. B7740]